MNMPQNSKCSLCGDRDEIVNHISEYSKLAQKKYKTRHDWVRKGINWELYKRLKFVHASKWYLPKPESVTEKRDRLIKLSWILRCQGIPLPMLVGRPGLVLINMENRTCHPEDFVVQADHRVIMKESEKINKYLDLARELKKLKNVTVIPIIVGVLGTVH